MNNSSFNSKEGIFKGFMLWFNGNYGTCPESGSFVYRAGELYFLTRGRVGSTRKGKTD